MPGREYVAEVAGPARSWLPQQLHAACDECEAHPEYPGDRALRRRVSAFQAMPSPLPALTNELPGPVARTSVSCQSFVA